MNCPRCGSRIVFPASHPRFYHRCHICDWKWRDEKNPPPPKARRLPRKWHQMTRDQQDVWSLIHHLQDEFPGFTFEVTLEPFYIRVNEDGVALKAIQAAADDWFMCAYGTTVQWGDPVHVD